MKLNHTTIRKLIRLLENLPPEFTWDFGAKYYEADGPCGCAIGLAYYKDLLPGTTPIDVSVLFGMTLDQIFDVFFKGTPSTRPRTVARRLTKLLIDDATKEHPAP